MKKLCQWCKTQQTEEIFFKNSVLNTIDSYAICELCQENHKEKTVQCRRDFEKFKDQLNWNYE